VEPIVGAFASALVAAMATDTWQEARAAVIAMWHRFRAQRADETTKELGRTRDRVLAARAGPTDTKQALELVWQGRLQELLLDNPGMTAEFQSVLENTLIPMLTPAERSHIRQIIMTGSSHDTSTFNQVAGNQTNLWS
jgi:hypothetical protein